MILKETMLMDFAMEAELVFWSGKTSALMLGTLSAME